MQDSESTPPTPPPQSAASGFFGRLFDFSFEEFITLQLIKVIYMIFVAFSGIGALVFFFGTVAEGGVAIVAGIVIAPLFFLVYVILARVWLEVLIVVFRISENTAELVRQGRGER